MLNLKIILLDESSGYCTEVDMELDKTASNLLEAGNRDEFENRYMKPAIAYLSNVLAAKV